MSLDTNTDILKFDSRGKGETIQIMTEGEMIVPDINPDIYQILKTEEDVIIDRVRAEQDGYAVMCCITEEKHSIR